MKILAKFVFWKGILLLTTGLNSLHIFVKYRVKLIDEILILKYFIEIFCLLAAFEKRWTSY